MTERERLMRRIASYDFAIVELHIYLDTHPNDRSAEAKLNEYLEKSELLRKEYTSKFGPLRANDTTTNSWAWISNPWPWDITEGDV